MVGCAEGSSCRPNMKVADACCGKLQPEDHLLYSQCIGFDKAEDDFDVVFSLIIILYCDGLKNYFIYVLNKKSLHLWIYFVILGNGL